MEKKKVQLTGNATIIGSKNLPAEVAEKMLDAPEGHHVELQVKIPATTLRSNLRRSDKSGSLTCHFAFKVEGFELVVVPDKDKEADKEVDLEALAASLM